MTEPSQLLDFEQRAQALMPSDHWAYVQGAAGEGHSAQANQAAWQAWRLWPRVLQRPIAGLTTSVTIGDLTLPHPVMLAPVAYQALVHPDGELATALAAGAQGAGMVLSAQSSRTLDAVARHYRHGADGGGLLWFQMIWQGSLDATLALVQRAQAAGFQAVVLTVDAPIQGVRDAERRHGFKLPAKVRAVNLPPQPARTLDDCLRRAADWDDLAALARALIPLGLPLWVKGVLHPDDARRCAEMGVAGLVVSNHGGRVLDTVVSTAWALPQVVAAVPSSCPVLVDGGIRRGTDVLKALALGARAVLVGRPQVHALAAGGAEGVAQMIRLLRDELGAAMALAGCHDLSCLDPQCLVPPAAAANSTPLAGSGRRSPC